MIKLLIWLPIFFLPSFQFARALLGIPASNTLLLLIPLGLGMFKLIKPTQSSVALIICSCIIAIHGALLDVLSPISLALIITPVLFIIAKNYEFTDDKSLPRIVAFVSIVNILLCLVQIKYPSLGLSNTNIGYDVSDHRSSTLEFILPGLPSLGRLRGIFNENGPMMLYLLMYTTFLSKTLKIFKSSAFRGRHIALDSTLVSLAIGLNVIAIFFTGSKTIIVSLPILLLVLLSTTRGFLSNQSFKVRLFVAKNPAKSFLMIYGMFFVLINFLPLLIDYLISQFFSGLVGIETRLATDSLRLAYISTEGLLPSSEGNNIAGSLSAYHIYTYAFGSIISTLLISSYVFFIIRMSKSMIYIGLILLAFLVSGSLMIPYYTQVILLCSFPPKKALKEDTASHTSPMRYNHQN